MLFLQPLFLTRSSAKISPSDSYSPRVTAYVHHVISAACIILTKNNSEIYSSVFFVFVLAADKRISVLHQMILSISHISSFLTYFMLVICSLMSFHVQMFKRFSYIVILPCTLWTIHNHIDCCVACLAFTSKSTSFLANNTNYVLNNIRYNNINSQLDATIIILLII